MFRRMLLCLFLFLTLELIDSHHAVLVVHHGALRPDVIETKRSVFFIHHRPRPDVVEHNRSIFFVHHGASRPDFFKISRSFFFVYHGIPRTDILETNISVIFVHRGASRSHGVETNRSVQMLPRTPVGQALYNTVRDCKRGSVFAYTTYLTYARFQTFSNKGLRLNLFYCSDVTSAS